MTASMDTAFRMTRTEKDALENGKGESRFPWGMTARKAKTTQQQELRQRHILYRNDRRETKAEGNLEERAADTLPGLASEIAWGENGNFKDNPKLLKESTCAPGIWVLGVQVDSRCGPGKLLKRLRQLPRRLPTRRLALRPQSP